MNNDKRIPFRDDRSDKPYRTGADNTSDDNRYNNERYSNDRYNSGSGGNYGNSNYSQGSGGGYQQRRYGSYNREGGSSGGYNREGGTGGYNRDSGTGSGYNRDPNFNREGSNTGTYNREGGYNRERSGGYGNRDGGYNRERSGGGGYGNRDGGGYGNRDGGGYGNRDGGGYGNRDGGGYNRERSGGGYGNRDGGYNRERSGGGYGNRDGGGYNRDGGGQRRPRISEGRQEVYTPRQEYRERDGGGGRSYGREGGGGYQGRGNYDNRQRRNYGDRNNRNNNQRGGYQRQQRNNTPQTPRKQSQTNLISLPRMMALNQFACRKLAVEFVKNSRVALNNMVVRDANMRVHPQRDIVTVDSMELRKNRPNTYILVNKATKMPASREAHTYTVHSMIHDSDKWYFPVGRLVKAASGLTILTNDAAHKDPHSAAFFGVEKEYRIKVHRQLKKTELTALTKILKNLHPEFETGAKVEVFQKNEHNCWISIVVFKTTLSEICKVLKDNNLEPITMQRYRIGTITADELTPGTWKQLSTYEVAQMQGQNTAEASFFFK